MKQVDPGRTMGGFSLIEMMVALAAGLIVIGAVLAFTVATVRAYNENIRSTRLTQDLRTSMNLAVREIRRAGYDSTSVTRVLTDNNPSPSFAGVKVSAAGDCFSYQYDRKGGDANRAIRYDAATGTLQAKIDSASVACADASGWSEVSDPSVVKITDMEVSERKAPFCVVLASTADPANPGSYLYDYAHGTVSNLSLCMKGSLSADPTLVRTIADSSRSRAEAVLFVKSASTLPAACTSAPGAAADALVTPSALNSMCGAP